MYRSDWTDRGVCIPFRVWVRSMRRRLEAAVSGELALEEEAPQLVDSKSRHFGVFGGSIDKNCQVGSIRTSIQLRTRQDSDRLRMIGRSRRKVIGSKRARHVSLRGRWSCRLQAAKGL
jgi:hypothetical protein